MTRNEIVRDILEAEYVDSLPVDVNVETISAVYAMQMKMGALFRQLIGGEIAGFQAEMDRETFPATFTITTWRKGNAD